MVVNSQIKVHSELTVVYYTFRKMFIYHTQKVSNTKIACSSNVSENKYLNLFKKEILETLFIKWWM